MTKQEWPRWLGTEPGEMKAYDTKVLCNGEPFPVDYRVVAEDTWQSLLNLCWNCRDERDVARMKIRLAKAVLDD